MSTMTTMAATELFKRLPDRIFSPLASENRHRFWSVLCALYNHRFGPDAPLPPSRGYLLAEMHKFIENHITYDDAWVEEGGVSPKTPVDIRAIGVFGRLQEAGWFKVERHGLERTVQMPPIIGQFLGTLIGFAEAGPVFVSGKIRSIEDCLSHVISGEAGGDSLREAADQARNLIEHIRNTGANVRDLMESLDPNQPTASYVRSFFSDYVEQVFIGDYRELKTRDHPLSRRQIVIDAAERLSHDRERRATLIDWYAKKLCGGDREEAASRLERDFRRILELSLIEEYLERLDEELTRANRRALAVLDYKIRATQPMDDLIRSAISNVSCMEENEAPAVFAPDALMSGARLYSWPAATERKPPAALRQNRFSPRDAAINQLMREAIERRSMTAPKLAAYVARALSGKDEISSADLPIESIEDLCAYNALHKVASMQGSGRADLRLESLKLARDFIAVPIGATEEPHPFISGRPFRLRPRSPRAKARPTTGEKHE